MTIKVMQICKRLPILVLLFLAGCGSAHTPLMQAARFGDVALVESLLKSGHNINEQIRPGDSDTALIWATHEGKLDTVMLLLDKGAQLDLQNQHGNTALIVASGKGHTEIAKLLINKGANLDIQDHQGFTALMAAVAYDKTEIAKMLIESRAKLDIRAKNGATALDIAINKKNFTIADILRAAAGGSA